jgi:hypothetical protein
MLVRNIFNSIEYLNIPIDIREDYDEDSNILIPHSSKSLILSSHNLNPNNSAYKRATKKKL